MSVVTKTRRKFNPGGFIVVTVFCMFLAGVVIGAIGSETDNWTMKWVGVGLISPIAIGMLSIFGVGLYHLSTTSKDDD